MALTRKKNKADVDGAVMMMNHAVALARALQFDTEITA
jgi:hypothetical protein